MCAYGVCCSQRYQFVNCILFIIIIMCSGIRCCASYRFCYFNVETVCADATDRQGCTAENIVFFIFFGWELIITDSRMFWSRRDNESVTYHNINQCFPKYGVFREIILCGRRAAAKTRASTQTVLKRFRLPSGLKHLFGNHWYTAIYVHGTARD